MRPRAILAIVLLTGSPPAVMAGAGSLSGSLWLGASGLQSRLTENGDTLELRAEHAGPLGDLFSGISRGTLLLRADRSGDSFSGTAYVFASGGCVFPYPVTGTIEKSVISWHGPEPKDRIPNSCRMTRSQFTITTVRLKWAPPAPTPPPDPPAWLSPPSPPVVKVSPPPRREPPSPSYLPDTLPVEMMVALGIAAAVALPLAAFALRWAYLRLAAILADGRLALAEKRAQLASVLPARASTGPVLVASEIENILAAGFSEIDPELRAALARALAAAIKDKNGS